MSLHTTDAPALTGTDTADLFVEPTLSAAIAGQVSTVVHTEHTTYRVPIRRQNPTAAWVNEGEEIPVSDAVFGELTVRPAKLAGLTVISSELANDSTPAAAEAVGQGLTADLTVKLDAAFFGALEDPAPQGLDSLTTTTTAGPIGVDLFATAVSLAEAAGSTIDTFVCSPATALQIATLKTAAGANTPLLGVDASNGTQRQILGVPIRVAKAVPDGTIWGLPRSECIVVVREDAELTTDGSVYFTSDRIAVRATMRVAFAFPHPDGIVKMTAEAPPAE